MRASSPRQPLAANAIASASASTLPSARAESNASPAAASTGRALRSRSPSHTPTGPRASSASIAPHNRPARASRPSCAATRASSASAKSTFWRSPTFASGASDSRACCSPFAGAAALELEVGKLEQRHALPPGELRAGRELDAARQQLARRDRGPRRHARSRRRAGPRSPVRARTPSRRPGARIPRSARRARSISPWSSAPCASRPSTIPTPRWSSLRRYWSSASS